MTLPLTDAARARFPDFPEHQELVVRVRPGEMLYLPAGWFHDVTSIGDSNSSDDNDDDDDDDAFVGDGDGSDGSSDGGAKARRPVHMAFNYWFHPPDRVQGVSSGADVHAPYSSVFWLADWRSRMTAEQRAHVDALRERHASLLGKHASGARHTPTAAAAAAGAGGRVDEGCDDGCDDGCDGGCDGGCAGQRGGDEADATADSTEFPMPVDTSDEATTVEADDDDGGGDDGGRQGVQRDTNGELPLGCLLSSPLRLNLPSAPSR